jgi:hypothetical protein
VSQRQRQQAGVGKVISQEFFALLKCTFVHGQSYIWIGPLTGIAAAHTPKAVFVKGPKLQDEVYHEMAKMPTEKRH